MSPSYVPLIELLIEHVIGWFTRRKKIRDLILPLIEEALKNGELPDNDTRREWVVAYLIREKGLSESSARLLVEAGIKLWKKITAKRIEKEQEQQAKDAKAAAKKLAKETKANKEI